jgi:TPR repeat protein
LALLYYNGDQVVQYQKKVIELLELVAKAGDAYAMIKLGDLLADNYETLDSALNYYFLTIQRSRPYGKIKL